MGSRFVLSHDGQAMIYLTHAHHLDAKRYRWMANVRDDLVKR